MIKTLLTSKRTYVALFTALAYVGVKFGITLDDASTQALAEAATVAAGGIATIITKLMDAKS